VSYRRVTVSSFGAAVVSIADAKAHLRVDFDDDDALIAGYVDAATRYVEKATGTAMRAQTWSFSLDRFWNRCQPLPGGRVTSVTSIQYYDVSETQQTLSTDDYIVSLGIVPAIVEAPNGWPGTQVRENAITITYVVDGPNEPGLLQAVKMLVAHWYENREAVDNDMKTVPIGFDSLINMHSAGWYG